MSPITHINDIWEHVIIKILEHEPESELQMMIQKWVIFNRLEDFNSLLNYTVEDFTPSGN